MVIYSEIRKRLRITRAAGLIRCASPELNLGGCPVMGKQFRDTVDRMGTDSGQHVTFPSLSVIEAFICSECGEEVGVELGFSAAVCKWLRQWFASALAYQSEGSTKLCKAIQGPGFGPRHLFTGPRAPNPQIPRKLSPCGHQIGRCCPIRVPDERVNCCSENGGMAAIEAQQPRPP